MSGMIDSPPEAARLASCSLVGRSGRGHKGGWCALWCHSSSKLGIRELPPHPAPGDDPSCIRAPAPSFISEAPDWARHPAPGIIASGPAPGGRAGVPRKKYPVFVFRATFSSFLSS